MDQVFDKLVALSKKRKLSSVADYEYLRPRTFEFLRRAKWPSSRETNNNIIYDIVYDLGYDLMDIWFEPLMAKLRTMEIDCHNDFDLEVQDILQTYFLEEIRQLYLR